MNRGNTSGRIVLRALAVCCGVPLVLLVLYASVEAFPCRPALIPNGGIENCANCHYNVGGGGPRNPFGQDVERFSAGCEPFWENELALLDSDDDGKTNGEELQDPEGAWRPGDPPPGDPGGVTNPGVKDVMPPPERFIRGDSNADGAVDISDAVDTLGFLFLGSEAPTCKAAADANQDGSVDITDAVYTLQFLFGGGLAPPPPFPECGDAAPEDDCAGGFPPCL